MTQRTDTTLQDAYVVQRYTQVSSASGKVKKSYMRRACAEADQKSFPDLVAELAGALRHVVFADSVVYAYEKRERLLALLEQHVNENLVKIGPHFYRQRVGIPQGSSLSTILCCFYLAELERTKLAFVRDRGCALLRYVDQVLLVVDSRTTPPLAIKRALAQVGSGVPASTSVVLNHAPGRTLACMDGY